MLAFMTACGKTDESASSGSESGSSMPQSTSQLNASSVPESSSSPPVADSASGITGVTASGSMAESTSQQVLLEGVFISSDTVRYTRERASRFELFTDGTFIFHLNLGDGRIGIERGTYIASGGTLVLSVAERELDDYLGENLESHTFTMLDNDHFIYIGDPLGMTRDQDKFTRDGYPDIREDTSAGGAESRTRIPPLPEPTSTIPASGTGAADETSSRVRVGGTSGIVQQ